MENKSVPFVDQVEEFNDVFGKLNNKVPTIPSELESKFIYDFILEELNEYKEAVEKRDIVGVLDAFCDIQYVLAAGILAFGLKNKFMDAFDEVQRSNMSKSCDSEEKAKASANFRSQVMGTPCHYEKHNGKWIVYRSSDRKAQKGLDYTPPILEPLFTKEELNNI